MSAVHTRRGANWCGGAAIFLAVSLPACTPTYDWREWQPAGAEVTAMFPCRPDRFSRTVSLGVGAPVTMQLTSCTTADTTFGLSDVQLADASQAGAALQALRDKAAENIGGGGLPVGPLQVPGMTPHKLAGRLRFEGRRPDGGALRAEAAFFTAGAHVYQATVVGVTLDAEAVDTFFTGLRLAPG